MTDRAASDQVILVVDDNPTTRAMLRLALQSEGYSIVEAGSGAAALEAMRHHEVDLVLQDWVLPDVGGLELARLLRALPGGVERPIIALSGFHRMLEETRGAPETFDGALVKPVELPALIAAVQEYLPPVVRQTPEPAPPKASRTAKLSSELIERSAMQAAQLAILGGIADALARSTDTERILGDALASCLDAGGISKGALFKAIRSGTLVPAHSIGFSEHEESHLGTLFGHPELLEQLARTRPLSVPSVSGALAEHAGLRISALLPCVWDGQIVGALLLGSNVPHVTEQDLLSFGRAMATYVSQAMKLSGAFASLNESADASRRLFGSLDVAATLETLVELATARLADLCEVRLVDGDGSTLARTVRHVDAEQNRRVTGLRDLHEGRPFPEFLATVVKSRRSELVRHLLPEVVEASGEPYASMMKGCGARSRIVVPLVARKRVLGTLMLTSSRLRPYDDSDVTVAEDLASRAAVAIDNGTLYQEMRAASALKDEFLATVSHELRTPLNSMLGWARLLRQGRLDAARTASALETIERNAVLQSQLVEDLLDLSQMVTGKLRVSIGVTDLVPVIDAAIDSVRATMAAKNITLVFDAKPDALLVLGDARRLQQVVWNLLSNAGKFTAAGGRVEIAAARIGRQAMFRVTDDGVGIDEQFLPFVFERFKQGDGRYARQWGGLGIGLAICWDLVTLHGGHIAVRSEGRGRGATFEVTLPLASEAAIETVPVEPAKAPPPAPETWPELRRLKVLIVEDEPDGRELLFHVLEQEGALPSVADSSAAALAAMKRDVPDVLVADIGLPGEDGYAMIRKIRSMAESAGGRVPAVALTACARPQDRIDAVGAGFQMHVAKPVDPDHLLAVVANLARMAAELKRGREREEERSS
jgi:signal transduction histidine kinase/DNA-binding response OmpR family regulator